MLKQVLRLMPAFALGVIAATAFHNILWADGSNHTTNLHSLDLEPGGTVSFKNDTTDTAGDHHDQVENTFILKDSNGTEKGRYVDSTAHDPNSNIVYTSIQFKDGLQPVEAEEGDTITVQSRFSQGGSGGSTYEDVETVPPE